MSNRPACGETVVNKDRLIWNRSVYEQLGAVAGRLGGVLSLPERPETGQRYELQDGEVVIVIVPPARPLHIKLQKRIERLFEAAAGDFGVVTTEFPYRPLPNLQYWFADVAHIPQADWDVLPGHLGSGRRSPSRSDP